MNIGLTGGIACGKSTVASMLVRRGALLIDADRIAREVVEPGTPALTQVIERFGADLLLEDGSLDRKKNSGSASSGIRLRSRISKPCFIRRFGRLCASGWRLTRHSIRTSWSS